MNPPPVPADLDLRDFPFMPLEVMRLIDSDLNALASGEEFKAAVILWCKAWHQVPAASLPDDDRLLAHLCGFGKDVRGWRKVRVMALRGFEKCEDGRLYHALIAEKAIEAGKAKAAQRQRTEAATLARKAKKPARDDQRHEERDDQRDDARNVHQGTGTGTGIKEDELCLARARDDSAILEARLREAAGWQSEPAPKLAVTGPIEALIQSGAILEVDILPTVKAIAPKARSRTSWQYFVKAIQQARDDRLAALVDVSPARRPANERSHAEVQRKSNAETIFTDLVGGNGESGDEVLGGFASDGIHPAYGRG